MNFHIFQRNFLSLLLVFLEKWIEKCFFLLALFVATAKFSAKRLFALLTFFSRWFYIYIVKLFTFSLDNIRYLKLARMEFIPFPMLWVDFIGFFRRRSKSCWNCVRSRQTLCALTYKRISFTISLKKNKCMVKCLNKWINGREKKYWSTFKMDVAKTRKK